MDYCIAQRGRLRRIAFLVFVTLAFAVVALSPAAASAAPTASIGGGPAEGTSTNASSITFTIAAMNDPANIIDFYCSFDGATFEPCDAINFPACVLVAPGQESCTQTKTYVSPAHGSHTFRVFASDCSSSCDYAYNWIDGPIVSRSFNVDRQAPVVTVTGGPSMVNPLLRGVASFGLSVSEPAQLYCSLDAAAPAPCASPFEKPRLANGAYELRVTATDGAGNVSAPVAHRFAVDIFKPKKCRKGKSAKAKAKRKKCVKLNAKKKVKWKKKHGLR